MVHVRAASPVGVALRAAIDSLRAEVGEPYASIAVVAPMRANAQFAQRSLVDTGSYMRVAFETPGALVSRIGRFAELERSTPPEPPGWLEATLAVRIGALADAGSLGSFGETLRRPIWIPTLVEAIRTLEGGGVDLALLEGVDDDVSSRARLLDKLVAEVRAARGADGIVSEWGIANAALRAIESDQLPESARFSGFVVLGDGVLAHGVHVAHRALFARVPTRRLAILPFDQVAPAPLGLRLAAGSAQVLWAESVGSGALAHARRRLFDSTLEAGPADDSLVMAATSDEVREITEAVRVVQRAIADGSPLERIAIALPDATQAHVLEDVLARAHIPATWLIGPPLSRSTPARFLTLALALAAPQPTIQTWYELIRHPGVLSAMRARGFEVHGSSRWRYLLSTSGAARHTSLICQALAHRAAAAEDPIEVAACDCLRKTIERFSSELSTLPATGRLAEHAAAFLEVLTAYQPPSASRAQLERLLKQWGAGGLGPALSNEQAVALLTSELEATQALRGAMSERAIRVVPPMALLGGDFDVVCVLGLTQGRLPAEIREHALLPDRFIAAVNARYGDTRLVPSGHRADAERRRFSAALASASHSLWLSAPRSDLLQARPAVPGALLLNVASALAGRRVTYRVLASMMVVTGGRDVFAPNAATDATSSLEHLLATLGADVDAGLAALGNHPWARRLLQLYRSIDRYHQPPDGAAAVLDGWSGHVDPAIIPHPALPGQPPISAEILAQAIISPTDYFFRHVLGAFRPSWLSGKNAPTEKWTLSRWMKKAIEKTLASPGHDLDAAFEAAWETVVADELRHRGPEDHDEAAVARDLARGLWDKIRGEVAALVPAERRSLDDLPVADDLPWHLRGTSDLVHDDVISAWDEESQPTKKRPYKIVALGLQALAVDLAGRPIHKLVLHGVDGSKDAPRNWSSDDARAQAKNALDRIEAGEWPVGGGDFRMHREPKKEDQP